MTSDTPSELSRLFAVMAQLRGPDGCPWDRAQDHRSLLPHLLEETHELIAAVEAGDLQEIAEELGDLLVQVAMHTAIAAERGGFDLAEVASLATTKMISRHPHVFEGAEVSGEEQLLRSWELLKRLEKPHRASALDGIPESLPALALASSFQRRAIRANSAVGPPVPAGAETMPRLQAALEDHAGASDQLIGELLWSVVGLARDLKVDPEGALRRSAWSWASSYREAEGAVGNSEPEA
ncbi:MAG: MazG family protein [Candidatus Dormibacteria bacterium]